MKLPRRNFLHLAAGAAALPVVSRIARAQAYPTRPVKIVVSVGEPILDDDIPTIDVTKSAYPVAKRVLVGLN